MMGCGKTAVGRALADQAGVPFVDLDEELERQAGLSIRQIFAEHGEASFRAMEREAVERELADGKPRVVALGGGSLLSRAVRLKALERGTVVTLGANPKELVRRVAGTGARPLLGEAPDEAKLVE